MGEPFIECFFLALPELGLIDVLEVVVSEDLRLERLLRPDVRLGVFESLVDSFDAPLERSADCARAGSQTPLHGRQREPSGVPAVRLLRSDLAQLLGHEFGDSVVETLFCWREVAASR